MKQFLKALLFCLLLTSCGSKNSINRITFQWNAHNSNGLKNCQDCTINTKECCEVIYKNIKYEKDDSYEFDKNGKIKNVYSYYIPEGVNIFSLDDFINTTYIDKEDLINLNKKLKSFRVFWDKRTKSIISNSDTIKNFEIDFTKKEIYLIKKDNLTIFEFN